ncbi:hypothetical protein MK805_03355 [Shimazuella sp. AN120528]|uniref:hypothetical protein n=1 Tax=Shimazuella soli TaxID=1892854 RepID=UPI001F11414F|nr:hypothetical protein [Shimazuella soli]MCH5584000.1 hypothetical protein [Shimazuella soli]
MFGLVCMHDKYFRPLLNLSLFQGTIINRGRIQPTPLRLVRENQARSGAIPFSRMP